MCVGYLYVYMVYVYGKIVQTLATSFIEFWVFLKKIWSLMYIFNTDKLMLDLHFGI